MGREIVRAGQMSGGNMSGEVSYTRLYRASDASDGENHAGDWEHRTPGAAHGIGQ